MGELYGVEKKANSTVSGRTKPAALPDHFTDGLESNDVGAGLKTPVVLPAHAAFQRREVVLGTEIVVLPATRLLHRTCARAGWPASR